MEPLPNAELFLACACPQPRCIMQSWRSCGYLLLQLQQSPPGSFREDDALSLSVDHRKVVLVRDGNGARLLDGHDTSDTRARRPIHLLQAIYKLVNKRQVQVTCKMVAIASDVEAQVRVDIHLHTRSNLSVLRSLWERQTWRKDSAAALIFARLLPLSKEKNQPSARLERLPPEHFSIASCFSELRLPACDPPLPATCHTGASLLGLPVEVLTNVIGHLGVQDICSLRMASKFCMAICREATPGLQLCLYPHQRTARRWMLQREAARGPIEPPTWRRFETAEGLPIWLCSATGDVMTEEPPRFSDIRGGLFCDEPGLGKTITALSLVLSTKGHRPAAPPGKEVINLSDAHGRRAAFYTVDTGDKQEGHGSASGVSRRSDRSQRPLDRYSPDDEKSAPKPPRPAPGRTLRSNSDSAVRQLAAEEAAQQDKQSKAARSPPHADGLRDYGCTAAGSPCHAAEGHHEHDGPLRKRQKLGSSTSDVGDSSCCTASIPMTTWVQCDACSKWRSLTQVPAEATWMCTMHPDPAYRSCRVPQERPPSDDLYMECDGYVADCSQMGASANVKYFGDLASRHLRSVDIRQRVLTWLSKLKHKDLLEGVKVPTAKLGLTATDQITSLLAELELTPISPDGKKTSSANAALWQQGHRLTLLYFDATAAREAAALCKEMASGPEAVQMRVYLSPATLLVVPATLIGHWREQIAMHTAEGALRVLVLDKAADGHEHTALDTAWHHDLVITTFQRLSVEWGKGRKNVRSLFSQVHWLRVILDEGHMLGASLQMTNKLSMAINLKAERRWIMTGTPTPSTPTSHVAHLQPLLSFLGQQPYGTQRNFWEVAVQKPFEAHLPEARDRLMQLLRHTAIRASKDDLETMVRRIHKVTRVDFAQRHAMSYNELVNLVKNNILTSDWGDEDHIESILSEKCKWNSQMFKNIRLSCNVAGVCNIAVKEDDLKETLEFLAERLELETVDAEFPPWLPETHPLAGIEASLRSGCDCQVCGAFARMPLVTPCGHLVCSDCAAPHRTECPSCKKGYLMQRIDDPDRKAYNTNPKWEVPLEFIEWQPSYTQEGAEGISGGEWSADWQVRTSSKILHLLKRLTKIGSVPKKAPPPSPQQDSIWQIPEGQPAEKEPLTKAIVFSHLWTHSQLIEGQLRGHGIHVALFKGNMKPEEKAAALRSFKENNQCSVLLMDEAGSVGLDLSFVSWVFLMEPLENASLEEQVISRAHRMGAKAAVQVETLVMRGTVEERVLEVRALQRRPAAEQGATEEPSVTAMDVRPGQLRVVAQQGAKRGATIREEHNAMLRALLCIKVADLHDVQDM